MSSAMEAEWRGSAKTVESTLTSLQKSLELCKATEIQSKIDDILKTLQHNIKHSTESELKFNIDSQLFEHINLAMGIVYENLNSKLKNENRYGDGDSQITDLTHKIIDTINKNYDPTKVHNDLTKENNDLKEANNELVRTNKDLTKVNNDLSVENRRLKTRLDKVKFNAETCLVDEELEQVKKSKQNMSDNCNKLKSLSGTLRILALLGLYTDDSTEQKICHINLDRKNQIRVISSTPAEVGNDSAACVINNDLYAVGIGSAYNELWKWSAERDEWTRLADLPSGRRFLCTTSIGEKIYVLGGCDDTDLRTLNSILCYDKNSNNWTKVTELCCRVNSAACVAYKHFIYVFGGDDDDDKEVNHVQVYDISTGEVIPSSNPMPAAQYLMRAVLWGSKALLVGDKTCYIYDIELKSWEERKRFKTDVVHFGLTLSEDTLHISGGGSNKTDENKEIIWIYSDEVKSLSVDDFISDNQQAEWKHHAKLPRPALVQSFNSQPLYRYI